MSKAQHYIALLTTAIAQNKSSIYGVGEQMDLKWLLLRYEKLESMYKRIYQKLYREYNNCKNTDKAKADKVTTKFLKTKTILMEYFDYTDQHLYRLNHEAKVGQSGRKKKDET